MRVLTPDSFAASAWKNGGGVTREIARDPPDGPWRWRLSIAEVASDGAFSAFPGLSRILTVIEGSGVDLHGSDGVIAALPLRPVAFAGDLPIDARLVDGPIRDLNVIYDAGRIAASVELVGGPCRIAAEQGTTAFLCLAGPVTADGAALPALAVALGSRGGISAGAGSSGLLVRLRDLA